MGSQFYLFMFSLFLMTSFELGFIVEVLKYHKNVHFIGLPDRFCAFDQLKQTSGSLRGASTSS